MNKSLVWNVRGLSKGDYQRMVMPLMKDHNVSLCGSKNFKNWNWVLNFEKCSGCLRIIVGWDAKRVDVEVLSLSDRAF